MCKRTIFESLRGGGTLISFDFRERLASGERPTLFFRLGRIGRSLVSITCVPCFISIEETEETTLEVVFRDLAEGLNCLLLFVLFLDV